MALPNRCLTQKSEGESRSLRLSNYFRVERTYFWDSLSRPTPWVVAKGPCQHQGFQSSCPSR